VKGKFVLNLLYSEEFVSAHIALLILSISHFFNTITGPKAALLAMTGHEKYLIWARGFTLVVSTLAKFLLIKHFGIEGAALGTGLTLVLWSVLIVYYGRKKLGIDPSVYVFLKPLLKK
jgi:O-antigen/teichoic acid export membrane protein